MLAKLVRSFGNDESGSPSLEYALVAGIISIAVVAGLTSASTTVNSTMTEVGTELQSNSSQ